MIIYGGIFEVCKELNDMHVFDLTSDSWLCVFEELNSPKKTGGNGGSLGFTKTPTMKEDRRQTGIHNKTDGLRTTGKRPITVNKKRKTKKPDLKSSTTDTSERVIKLESPTSISMKNSFLIREEHPSFEKCYAQIKKRAIEKSNEDGFDSNLTKV